MSHVSHSDRSFFVGDIMLSAVLLHVFKHASHNDVSERIVFEVNIIIHDILIALIQTSCMSKLHNCTERLKRMCRKIHYSTVTAQGADRN